MTRGIYTAATGMMAEEAAQQVIAQNLANASTIGYKQDIPVFKSFAETLISAVSENGIDNSAIGALGHGATLDHIYTDLSQGSVQYTGNQLDIAMRGDAYLAVQSVTSTLYSRDGSLALSPQGLLIQASTGLPVLDNRGKTITIPESASKVSIAPDGTITADGQTIDELGLYAIDQSDNPTKMGDNLISTPQTPKQLDGEGASGYVEQGYLEESNVNIVKEMVTMIACQRSYEANAKAMQSQDQMADKVASTVGTVD